MNTMSCCCVLNTSRHANTKQPWVLASFEGEFEREREEAPLTKVGDLVSEEPGVLSERCLSGDGKAICMQESNVRLSKELCQCLQLDGIFADMKDAMTEGAQGSECV